MRTLVYIDSIIGPAGFETLKKHLNLLNENSKPVIIAGNAVIMDSLNENGFAAKPITLYQDSSEISDVFAKSLQLAETWFLDKNETDPTLFDEVSIGHSLKYPVSLYFNHILKSINNVQRILQTEKPDSLLLIETFESRPSFIWDTDIHFSVFKLLANKLGLKLEVLSIAPKDSVKNTQDNLSNLIKYGFPSILEIRSKVSKVFTSTLKRICIASVDGLKKLQSIAQTKNPDNVKAFVISASDLTYLGKEFSKRFTDKTGHFLFYLKKEMNCYFNSRLLYAGNRGLAKIKGNQKYESFLKKIDVHWKKQKHFDESDPIGFYKDVPIFKAGEHYFKLLYELEFPKLARFIIVMKRALKDLGIQVVLTTNHTMPESVIAGAISEKHHIPTLYIPHGHIYGNYENGILQMNPGMDINCYPHNFSYHVVGLKLNMDILKKNNYSGPKAVLGGMPRFEMIQAPSKKNKTSSKSQLGFKPEDKVILFGSTIVNSYTDRVMFPYQFGSFDTRNFYEKLIDLFSKKPSHTLILKLRSTDIMFDTVHKLISKKYASNILVMTDNLDTLFSASDAVLALRSNIGIEALFYDLPIIQYIHPSKPNLLPLTEDSGVIRIKELEELFHKLDRLKEDEEFRLNTIRNQKEFLMKNLPQDGLNSGTRIINYIDRLAKEHSL